MSRSSKRRAGKARATPLVSAAAPSAADLDRARPPVDGSRPWRTTAPVFATPLSPLEHLRRVRAARARLDVRQAVWVDAARADGQSWGSIGLALGVSAQAVQQRYGSAQCASGS